MVRTKNAPTKQIMGGVRLIYIWQMTLTLIEFQEGVHFRRKGGAVVFGNAPPFTANAIP